MSPPPPPLPHPRSVIRESLECGNHRKESYSFTCLRVTDCVNIDGIQVAAEQSRRTWRHPGQNESPIQDKGIQLRLAFTSVLHSIKQSDYSLEIEVYWSFKTESRSSLQMLCTLQRTLLHYSLSLLNN